MRPSFDTVFRELTGHAPREYQVRLARRLLEGRPPTVIEIPTGMGKTLAVMTAWLYALAADLEQVREQGGTRRIWMRLHLVVDRRAVVDTAFTAAGHLRDGLASPTSPAVSWLAGALRTGVGPSRSPLEVLRLRGGLEDRPEHTRFPACPTIVLGTLDMTVSRLLFRGYQLSARRRSIDAALTGTDSLWVLDEAHLSTQAYTTLRLMESHAAGLEDRFDGAVPPLSVIAMSATGAPRLPGAPRPPSGDEVLTIDWEREEARDPGLARRRRARASTPVRVHDAVGRPAATMADLAARRARTLGTGQSLVVFCNTVRTVQVVARKVTRACGTTGSPALKVLVGGMPTRHTDALMDALAPYRTGSPQRSEAAPVVVVATSTLEVGADLDFTFLMTETCQAPSLVQRLGRVNRVGDRTDGGVDVVCATQVDPIHGEAAAAVGTAVRGATTLSGLLGGLERGGAELTVPEQVPVLLPPASLRAYLRTLGSRNDQPVSPWIRPLQDQRGDVTLVFRDSLGLLRWGVRPEVVLDDLRQWPPDLRAEGWTMSVDQARTLVDESLRQQGGEPVGLVVMDPTAPEPVSHHTAVPDLRPGQVLVLDPGYAGPLLGALHAATDLSGQVVPLKAEDRGLRAAQERLTAMAAGQEPATSVLTDLGTGARRSQDPYGELLEASAELVAPAGTVLGREVLGEETPTPWLRLTLTPATAGPVPGRSRNLREHGAAVGARAGAWARAMGLPPAVVADLVLAGTWHDEGKRDPRTQAALTMGLDAQGYLVPPDRPPSEPVARSGLPYRYWRRSRDLAGVPPRWRHEALSAELLGVALEQGRARAHDVDLVLHLVLSHHGYFRGPGPLTPPGVGPRYQDPADPLWAEATRRFHRLNDRYGPYTLALAETVLRLADWDVSREEQDHGR